MSDWTLPALQARLAVPDVGCALHDFIATLYPICRSITGDGVRRTLALIDGGLSLTVHEVPSGTPVLDWSVPPEWNIRDAWITNAQGRKVVDFRRCNLHVMGYSTPVHRRMTLAELKPHLRSLPDHPDWIPFHSSFYKEDWAFCLAHNELQRLPDGEYEVCIDATLAPGHLTYGEVLIPGQSDDEILLCCHVCHPSLCNDNLSGIAVLTMLGRYLRTLTLRHSVRVVFLPVTIGAITWLARNEAVLPRIRHGLVVTLVGDAGGFTYKRSRRGDAAIDRAFAHVLRQRGGRVIDFSPYGYDERQFCSPGFDLPVGCLMRTPHGEFAQYHTSADDLDFVRPDALAGSLACVLQVLGILESDRRYLNRNPKGEPQLGRRGVFRALAERTDGGDREMAMLWVLNQSDGAHSLLDIAERAAVPFQSLRAAADVLLACDLLSEVPAPPSVPSAGGPP